MVSLVPVHHLIVARSTACDLARSEDDSWNARSNVLAFCIAKASSVVTETVILCSSSASPHYVFGFMLEKILSGLSSPVITLCVVPWKKLRLSNVCLLGLFVSFYDQSAPAQAASSLSHIICLHSSALERLVSGASA